MRFACQSCGKAYNLPEERIAEKSNVKLKCRVCGAIVEVKRQGEIVARILDDGKNELGRVSEAPAPLTSLMPDDGDDATAAIAFNDHILSESVAGGEIDIRDSSGAELGSRGWSGQGAGLSHRGLPAVPPLAAPPPAAFGATPMPPPLSQHGSAAILPEPPLPPMPLPDSPAPPLPVVGPGAQGMNSPPRSSLHSADSGAPNGASPLDTGLLSPMAPAAVGGSGPMSAPSTVPQAPSTGVERDDTNMKMLAALATGILIGFIIARLFF